MSSAAARATLVELVRDPDGDGYSCGPSTRYAERVADAVLAAGFRRVAEDPEPNAWRIEVTVPLRLPVEQRHELFGAVVSAVEDWEPAPSDRDGWDADVSGHPVHDEFLFDDGGAALRGGGQS